MRSPELRIALDPDEITIDNFAGGGGASTGMDQALAGIGRHVDIAINHDPEAIAMHRANHPETEHYTTDVFHVDIVKAVRGRRVGFAWYSPDCTFHSKARGGKPFRDRNKARRIRGLAWIIIKQAKQLMAVGLAPRLIGMENVQEFADWGPLDDEGKIIEIKKGLTFRRWCKQFQNLGYELEIVTLAGMDYGAGTTRERLFIIARRDGRPLVVPQPTHGRGLKPYVTAADSIDFDLPCPSIFTRKRPLAENTMKRIFEGIRRYVIDCAEPFIVPVAHQGDSRANSINEPLRTITAERRGDFAIVQPFIAGVGGRMGQSPARSVDRPMQTITAKGDAAIVTPYIAKYHGAKRPGDNRTGDLLSPLPTQTTENRFALVSPVLVGAGGPSYSGKPASVDRPMGSQTTENHRALVAPVLVPRYGEREGQRPRARSAQLPLPTIVTTDNGAELVAAYLAKQNGVGDKIVKGQSLEEPVHTITTKDQKGLVTSCLVKFKGTSQAGQPVTEPLHTVQAGGLHYAEVRAFLIKYYSEGGQWGSLKDPLGTLTTRDRIGLVTIHGEDYVIVDIGLRMLTPRELYRAQGFPPDYQIEVQHRGKPLTKTAQVRMVGNSVCPQIVKAIVEANLGSQRQEAVA